MKMPIGIMAVALAFLAPAAFAQNPVPVGQLSDLAGTWNATNDRGNPVELVMQPDGRFEARITDPATKKVFVRQGQARLEGGEVRYDADLSSGRITLGKNEAGRAFTMHGTYNRRAGSDYLKTFTTEYTEEKK